MPCAFEQHPRAGASDLAQALPHRLRELEHKRRNLGQFGDQLGTVDRRFAKPGAQRVMVRAQTIELRIERVEMCKIAHANGPPADLILIGGSDAAPRGSDLALAAGILAQRIEIAVEWQDQRAVVCNRQVVRSNLHPLPAQLLDLVAQRPGIEHDAIADHAERAAHDPRRQQRQLEHLFTDDQRMPGIMAALEADHCVGPLCQPVDDLALAFIAPLGADHGYIGHKPTLFDGGAHGAATRKAGLS